MNGTEEPCKVTGKGCRWSWCCDPSSDEDSYCCGEMYCMDCYESKDWNLKDYGEEDSED